MTQNSPARGRPSLEDVVRLFDRDGFVLLDAWLDPDDLLAARNDQEALFPTADAFHSASKDPAHDRFRIDSHAGIDHLPFAALSWTLLAVHPDVVVLAEALLRSEHVRIYAAEAWAKYAGAATYEQHHHRDFLNHTIVVPSADTRFRQIEMFVYLSDVPDADHGAVRMVPNRWSAGLDHGEVWFAPRVHPALYENEVVCTGPAGTVVAYSTGTVHRAGELRAPGAARFTLHLNFERTEMPLGIRDQWPRAARTTEWAEFVRAATPRQLEVFGFPRPGHPFWTPATVTALAERYPDLDVAPWRAAIGGSGPA